jgi:hypothetical protein
MATSSAARDSREKSTGQHTFFQAISDMEKD